MLEVAIGLDIGTSYTKAAARRRDGSIVAASRMRSPLGYGGFWQASEWWRCLCGTLASLLADGGGLDPVAICVSAIAPTLIVCDASDPDRAFGVLYSSLADVANDHALSQCDRDLTDRRLAALRGVAAEQQLGRAFITDLVGYINWRMTGALTINSISLAEAGLANGAHDCAELAVRDGMHPTLVAAAEQVGAVTPSVAADVGIKQGTPVCGGCPDTMSSVVGAGLTSARERMLYLGTFGSLLVLEDDVDVLLNTTDPMDPPFHWLLSVPGFGPKIEALSAEWFEGASGGDAVRALDEAATCAPPGARGTVFLLPRWKNGMRAVGAYELVAKKGRGLDDRRERARAVLEGYAYAALALGGKVEGPIKASGGGARSRTWLDILSIVLGTEIQAQDMAWEAAGASDIAGRLAWGTTAASRTYYETSCADDVDRAQIADNCHRSKELYREHDWL